MIRKKLAVSLAGAAVLATAVMAPTLILADTDATTEARPYTAPPKGEPLAHSKGETALVYDSSLTPGQIIRRAEIDAQKLGVTVVRTMAAARAVVVNLPEDEVRLRLAAAEGLPIVGTTAAYRFDNSRDAERLAVFTDRLMIKFRPGMSESAKQQWLAARGWTRLSESATGGLTVATGLRPDQGMIAVARDLGHDPAIAEASHDIAATARLASNSITATDDLLGLQWTHDNSGYNTNDSRGRRDTDLDVPRAWMINKRNATVVPGVAAAGPFGSPTVTVAVFDKGVELGHEDLAQNIDVEVGIDYIDGGLPLPAVESTNVHGTAMASLVAAAVNGVGIAGIAPDTRVYVTRVIQPDNTFSTINMVRALQDSIVKNSDVNLHAYEASFGLESSTSSSIETGFRQTLEGGRDGIGIVNIASAGNFYSQVSYPAQSLYCFAVGSFDSEASMVPQSNWGGMGVDFSMPSFNPDISYAGQARSTGVLMADYMGNPGFHPGGNYMSVGDNDYFGSLGNAAADSFGGTSIAAAQAAGVVAMMLADPRYTEMRPLILPPVVTSEETSEVLISQKHREYRKLRAPKGGPYILSQLFQHADLPANTSGFVHLFQRADLNVWDYVNQFHERKGHGAPNPARLALFNIDNRPAAATGRSTPDSPFISEYPFDGRERFTERTVYEARFDTAIDPAAFEEPEELVGALLEARKGWGPSERDRIQIGAGDDALVISPAFVPVTSVVFPDGTVTPDEGQFYTWVDSLPLIDEDAGSNEAQNNILHNPYGRYLANRTVTLESPDIFVNNRDYSGQPLILTLQIAHGLGVQIASDVQGLEEGDSTSTSTEVDTIFINVQRERVFSSDDGVTTKGLDLGPSTAGVLTGDSREEYKERIVGAPTIEVDFLNDALRPDWPNEDEENPYFPWVRDNEMVIRTYRFVVPGTGNEPGPDGDPFWEARFRIQITLNPNNSWLPSYEEEFDEGEGITTYTQLYNVYRDDNGFLLWSAKLDSMTPFHTNQLNQETHVVLTQSRLANWSSSRQDILFVHDEFGQDSRDGRIIGAAEPNPIYTGLEYDGDANSTTYVEGFRQHIDLYLYANEKITGLRPHPFREVIAFTADDGTNQSLYMATNDGINQTRLLNPQLTVGARDPRWSQDGKQLIFAGPDYIRLISFPGVAAIPSNVSTLFTETIIRGEDVGLTDFRSPVIDPDGGLFTFVARDNSGSTPGNLALYVCTRNGRLLNYSNFSGCPDGPTRDPVGPFLFGWEGVDMYDLEVSYVGHRLLFVANAALPPSPPSACLGDDTTGGSALPAELDPDGATRLFSIENYRNVLWYNDPPDYREIALRTDIEPTAGQYSGVRFPRVAPFDERVSTESQSLIGTFHAGQEVMYLLTRAEDTDLDAPRGAINIRQPLSEERVAAPELEIAPIPVTPVPDPAPGQNPLPGRVNLNGRIAYQNGTDGWVARDGGSALAAPLAEYNRAAGTLNLTSRGNNNTFGYYESPSGLLQVRNDSLYLVRASVRGNASTAAAMPSVRVRVNSQSLESAFTSETNSLGDLSLSLAGNQTRNYDLLFKPAKGIDTVPIERRNYTAAVDLLNFFPTDDPNGGVVIDEIELYRLDDGGNYVAMFSFYTPVATVVDLTARPLGLRQDGLSVAVRRCIGDNTNDVACSTGEAISGLTLNNVAIPANATHVVVVSARYAQDIELTWSVTSGGPLLPAGGDTGTFDGRPCVAVALATTSVAIGGLSGTAINRALYMGDGSIPEPLCAPLTNRTVVSAYAPVYDADFSNAALRAGWTTGPDPRAVPYANPDFLQRPTGFALRVLNGANTFGYWTADGTTIPVANRTPDANGVAIYRAVFTIANDFESNKNRLPDLRVRLSTDDFQRNTSAQIGVVQDGSTVPTPGITRQMETYMVLETVPSTFENFVVGFDILSFHPTRNITSQPIELRGLLIERLTIDDYPAPR